MYQSARFISQIRLPEIGDSGQSKLSGASVLIVGCGALGSPAAVYLAAAGIGSLTIADFDNVELSNLHRQVFYSEDEIGKEKAKSLKDKIMHLNSQAKVEVEGRLVNAKFLRETDKKFDVILDCADNPASTYLLADYCHAHGIPLSTAGVSGWQAQVFNYIPGSTSYSDIIAPPEDEGGVLPCSITGIIGPTASFASSLQAAFAIKSVLGIAGTTSMLITANLLNNEFNVMTC